MFMDIALALNSRQAMQVLVDANVTKFVISRSWSYALMSPAAGPFDKSALCKASVFMSTDSCTVSFDDMTKTLYCYCGVKVRK